MKCPKCGFNSFEYYDSCKKCSNDLTAYKQTYSIVSLVLPMEEREQIVAGFDSPPENDVVDQASPLSETHDDIFSFDLPDEPPALAIERNDDPFNFDEPEADVKPAVASTPAEDDVFASLLESTSQADESPFGTEEIPAAPAFTPPPAAPAPAAPDFSSAPGEFDLESFSWDETPQATVPTATDANSSNSASTDALDDFDSLFGDTNENGSK